MGVNHPRARRQATLLAGSCGDESRKKAGYEGVSGLAGTAPGSSVTELDDRVVGVCVCKIDGIFMLVGGKVAVGHGRMLVLDVAMTVALG